MNNALYVGLSRQLTLKRQMDVIANNIANSDTVGFKVESLELGQDVQRPAMAPGQIAAESITFVHDTGLARDFRQGALRQTGLGWDYVVDAGRWVPSNDTRSYPHWAPNTPGTAGAAPCTED